MKRILVIEDNPLVAKMVQFILRGEEYDVRVVHDGEAGVAMVQEYRPDLVISDIMLPHGDGFSLVERIRNILDVPVMLMTALASADARSRGIEAGAIDFITKPFDPQDFVLRVKSILENV